jgi:YHS domain-containing protein
MKRVLIVLIVLVAVCAVAWAIHTAKQTDSSGVVSAVCPVMGTKIPDVTKAAGTSVYKGKTYYFCCPGCKTAFDQNPAKYVPAGK